MRRRNSRRLRHDRHAHAAAIAFASTCRELADRTDRFSIVRTMHHPAAPQFRNEHNAAMYMLQTGRCELPPGENTNTIALPKPRRFEWPSIGSAIAYALPARRHRSACRRSSRCRAANCTSCPARGPGMLGSKYAALARRSGARCAARPTAAASCPNCFSHDQPNDPARAPGKQPGAWWDNSSCRNPDFHLPDLGLSTGLSLENLQSRADAAWPSSMLHGARSTARPAVQPHGQLSPPGLGPDSGPEGQSTIRST